MFIDYISVCHKNKKSIMSLSYILCIRNDITGVYFEFLEYFVSLVIRKNYFRYNCCDELLAEYSTVCDQVLAIFIFKNIAET